MADRPSLRRYAVISILAALATIALKGGAYGITGSVGLLSDALESLVNLAAAVVALIALAAAARPEDEDHRCRKRWSVSRVSSSDSHRCRPQSGAHAHGSCAAATCGEEGLYIVSEKMHRTKTGSRASRAVVRQAIESLESRTLLAVNVGNAAPTAELRRKIASVGRAP